MLPYNFVCHYPIGCGESANHSFNSTHVHTGEQCKLYERVSERERERERVCVCVCERARKTFKPIVLRRGRKVKINEWLIRVEY